MHKYNLRRISTLVASQTLYHLFELAIMCGYGHNIGKVIDKLVREKMLELKGRK